MLGSLENQQQSYTLGILHSSYQFPLEPEYIPMDHGMPQHISLAKWDWIKYIVESSQRGAVAIKQTVQHIAGSTNKNYVL